MFVSDSLFNCILQLSTVKPKVLLPSRGITLGETEAVLDDVVVESGPVQYSTEDLDNNEDEDYEDEEEMSSARELLGDSCEYHSFLSKCL